MQHDIAAVVAVGVVDALEMVDVQQQHRERAVAAAPVQRDLAAQHRGQEAAIEQAGERVAAVLHLDLLLEQPRHVELDRRQVVLQLLDERAHQLELAFDDRVEPRQQLAIDALHGLGDQADLGGALEQRRRAMAQPQPEFGLPQPRQRRVQIAMQVDQHAVPPLHQRRALALALHRDVLPQRMHAVRLVDARLARGVLQVARGAQLHRQVQQVADVGRGVEQLLGRQRRRAQAFDDPRAQLARAARDGLYRIVQPRQRLARGALLVDAILDGRRVVAQQLREPAVHGELQLAPAGRGDQEGADVRIAERPLAVAGRELGHVRVDVMGDLVAHRLRYPLEYLVPLLAQQFVGRRARRRCCLRRRCHGSPSLESRSLVHESFEPSL